MRICYLGAGTWGFALAYVLGNNGNRVQMWSRNHELIRELQKTKVHPRLKKTIAPENVFFTNDLEKALQKAQLIVESVTSSGIRQVFEQVGKQEVPIILTSKGIEQKTGLLLPEVVSSVFNVEKVSLIGVLSGPSHAEDMIVNRPTSVVCSSYDKAVMKTIQKLFSTPTFRIYPNTDLLGVCFGGAMKNIIAIACGISDGLDYGDNAKAALMTRGLHEIRKLGTVKNCNPETLNGLSGMGDLCVTCMSPLSRNYRFGKLVAQGFSPEGARQKIGMAVEGIYTCVSALELGKKYQIPTPITEATYQIIYQELDPRKAVKTLLNRAIKEEHL